jgi:hypothetical protein
MFDRFGEFDTSEELNRAAVAQMDQGDFEAIRLLAEENGLGEYAEDFIDGYSEMLCNELEAALGKLEVEKKHLGLEKELLMLEEELEKACMDDLTIAIGVRRKGKKLAIYLARIIDQGFREAVTPNSEILNALQAVPQQYRNQIKTGMPDKAARTEIMKTYYEGGANEGV